MRRAIALALLSASVSVGAGSLPVAAQGLHPSGQLAERAPEPEVVSIPTRRPSSEPSAEKAANPAFADPAALAREAQRELRRVGCYQGDISGVWTTTSRMAAQNFTDRINARLPIDKPDEILVALLKGQAGTVCAAPCPPDQSSDGKGRCVPAALASKAPPQNAAAPAAAAAAPQRVAAAPPKEAKPEGRLLPAQAAVAVGQIQIGGENALVQRPRQAQPEPKSLWKSFVRSVDKALGLY